jgi:hypothetical protein
LQYDTLLPCELTLSPPGPLPRRQLERDGKKLHGKLQDVQKKLRTADTRLAHLGRSHSELLAALEEKNKELQDLDVSGGRGLLRACMHASMHACKHVCTALLLCAPAFLCRWAKDLQGQAVDGHCLHACCCCVSLLAVGLRGCRAWQWVDTRAWSWLMQCRLPAWLRCCCTFPLTLAGLCS